MLPVVFELSTPSLGITGALRALELQGFEVSFQLPLSGSHDDSRRRAEGA
jgi:hypothetical protein